MPNKKISWRQIGWDGIQLQVPASWHSAAVYNDFLLFESNHQPACALKWQYIKGRFDPSKILKQLQKSFHESKVSAWQAPQEWSAFLQPFTHQGFCWQGDGKKGTGLVLYTLESNRALLLQFYEGTPDQAVTFKRILKSLQIQQQGKKQLWSMFDIRIQLPREAVLTEHEFLPGSFRLKFSLAKLQLTYYRFKPAAELLRHQSLDVFGATIAKEIPLNKCDELLCQWQKNEQPGFNILARLRRKPTCATVRLWQVIEENALLGLKVQGNAPLAEEHFATLCADYSTC